MKNDLDTITCADKEDAKSTIDSIGGEHIKDWEFLENGSVKLILNCRLERIKEVQNEQNRSNTNNV